MDFFKESFSEPEVNFPDVILGEAIKNFTNATSGLAVLSIYKPNDIEKISFMNSLPQEFVFKLVLHSPLVEGYSFELLSIGYGVTLFPVSVVVQSEVAGEIALKPNILGIYRTSCSDESSLLELLAHVFQTNKFKSTVGGLMKIARTKASDK